MTNKYFAKPCFYDIENNCILEYRPADALPDIIARFDSQLELKVFLTLIEVFDRNAVKRQHRIELKPKTRWSNAMFCVVDFYIACLEPFYVEAKGLMTPESKMKIKMLEIAHPAIRSNLILVSDKETHYFGKQYKPSVSISDLRSYISKRNTRATVE